jgi:hypothetical protein
MEKECVICGRLTKDSICSHCEREIGAKTYDLLSGIRYPLRRRGRAGVNPPTTGSF